MARVRVNESNYVHFQIIAFRTRRKHFGALTDASAVDAAKETRNQLTFRHMGCLARITAFVATDSESQCYENIRNEVCFDFLFCCIRVFCMRVRLADL